MKKILDLTGIQKLSKEQQQHIKGAWGRITCCPSGRGCLLRFGNQSFCEPGHCNRWGGCILY